MKIQKYKHDSEYSYALGMTLTIELLKFKAKYVEKVLLSTRVEENENIELLKDLCEKNNIEIEYNEKAFNILSPKGNCFVIGLFRKFENKVTEGSHVVLVNPSDAGNLGTIIRTATGFDLPKLVIIRPGVDIFDPKVVRASMGALFRIEFSYYDTFEEYRKDFPKQNCYSFMLTSSKPINQVEFKKPYSLIFGNEATGLPEYFANISQTVIIPHKQTIDSLNLPIAASIGMFSATKNDMEI